MNYNSFFKGEYQSFDLKKYIDKELMTLLNTVNENKVQILQGYQQKMKTFIIRYENLQNDFNTLLGTLGYGPISLPHAKASFRNKKLGIEYYFTKEQIKIINTELKEYFEFFSYPMIEV